MTTPDDRREGRPPRQSSQPTPDRQARPRRGPLFPLDDHDIAPRERSVPLAPMGDLLGDIDQALPIRTTRERPATRPSSPPREQAPPPRPVAPPRPATPSAPRREAAPLHETPAPRPTTTRERPAHRAPELRVAPVDDLVEETAAPLREARDRYDTSAAHLARLEQHLPAGAPPRYGGYLAPAPPAPSLSGWAWMLTIALASALVLATIGSGVGGAGLSRWGIRLPGEANALVNRAPLFVGPARPVGDYTLRAPPSVSAELIDRILASYGSPAAGTGQVWYNLGLKYGIDPAFAVAFFIHESGAGTASGWAGLKPDGGTTHNVGNIICAGYSTCYGRFRDYASWEEGIDDWYKLIDVEYLNGRGHQTVADIIPVYAPSFENDVNGYVNVVQRLVDQWRAQGAP